MHVCGRETCGHKKKKRVLPSYFYSLSLNNILCLHKGPCNHLFAIHLLSILNSKLYNCWVAREEGLKLEYV